MTKVLWQQTVCISLIIWTLMVEMEAVVGYSVKRKVDNIASLFDEEDPDVDKIIKLSQMFGLPNLILQGHGELLRGFQDGGTRLPGALIHGADQFGFSISELEELLRKSSGSLDSWTNEYLDGLISESFMHMDENTTESFNLRVQQIIGLDNYTDFDTYLEGVWHNTSREIGSGTRSEFIIVLRGLLRRVKAEVKSRLALLNNQLRFLIVQINQLQMKNDVLGKLTITEWFTGEVNAIVRDHKSGYLWTNMHWTKLVSTYQKTIIELQARVQKLNLEIVKYKRIKLRLEAAEQENRKLIVKKLTYETEISVLTENSTELQRYRVMYLRLQKHYIVLRACYLKAMQEAVAIRDKVRIHIQSLSNITINAEVLKPGVIGEQAMAVGVTSTWAQLQEMFTALIERKQDLTNELHRSREENAMLRSTVETGQRLLLWMKAQMVAHMPHVNVDEELNSYASLIQEGYTKFEEKKAGETVTITGQISHGTSVKVTTT